MSDTDCAERFREFRRAQTRILDEDLEALQRWSESERIERYNDLKRQEEAFDSSFRADCPSFLTDTERERVRGEFRLARLLLAASFYAEGDLPRALADEFTTAELDAVVAFDRYSIFDTLSEEQIEAKIRRMEGEVYELVTEYTSTQLANIDSLTEQSDIQQVVVDRLLARYAERREKIRRGFVAYVETHGLEHTVGVIEDAVRAVAEASKERSTVHAELQATLKRGPSDALDVTQRDTKSAMATASNDPSLHGSDASSTDAAGQRLSDIADEHDRAVDALEERLDRLEELEARLDDSIKQLSQLRDRTEATASEAPEEVTAVVDAELDALREEQSELRQHRDRVELKRWQLDHTRDRLSARQQSVDAESEEADDRSTDTATIDSSRAVSTSVARLMEMDYLGRFDISMGNATAIRTPDGNVTIPDGYWTGRSERRTERARLGRLLGEAADPSNYPVNQTARYEITNDRYLGLSETLEMVIEATVFTTLESHVRAGCDAQPADLDDLLRFVDDAVHEAHRRDCAYLLAIASPTGWTDDVREQIVDAEIARSRLSDAVSICLVDLRTGELLYDETDPVVAENADLFEPVVETERVAAAVETLRTAYLEDIGTETVALQTVVEEHDINAQVVSQAFHQLADDGEGELLYVDDVGPCLEVGR